MLIDFRLYMIDGVYQSVMVFFIPYILIMNGKSITFNSLDLADRLRFGAYIAHPSVLTINMYILINTYRWDWFMVLIVVISDLFIFFWTGIYSSFTSGVFFHGMAAVYGEATFWAAFFLVPIVCLFPRFAIKALQKVYWPYDVDIIREQERLGAFSHIEDTFQPDDANDSKSAKSKSSSSSRQPPAATRHVPYGSVDEDLRPIYPPSTVTRTTTHNHHSQNGSDSTQYTNRMSLDAQLQGRPSYDRARPSYDRVRMSMDRLRPSFEASNDMTSAARLSRIESSQSSGGGHRFRPRLRGLSLSKSAAN